MAKRGFATYSENVLYATTFRAHTRSKHQRTPAATERTTLCPGARTWVSTADIRVPMPHKSAKGFLPTHQQLLRPIQCACLTAEIQGVSTPHASPPQVCYVCRLDHCVYVRPRRRAALPSWSAGATVWWDASGHAAGARGGRGSGKSAGSANGGHERNREPA